MPAWHDKSICFLRKLLLGKCIMWPYIFSTHIALMWLYNPWENFMPTSARSLKQGLPMISNNSNQLNRTAMIFTIWSARSQPFKFNSWNILYRTSRLFLGFQGFLKITLNKFFCSIVLIITWNLIYNSSETRTQFIAIKIINHDFNSQLAVARVNFSERGKHV